MYACLNSRLFRSVTGINQLVSFPPLLVSFLVLFSLLFTLLLLFVLPSASSMELLVSCGEHNS